MSKSCTLDLAAHLGVQVPRRVLVLMEINPLLSASAARDLGGLTASLRGGWRPHRTPPAKALAAVVRETARRNGWDHLGWRDPGPAGAALVGLARRTTAAGRSRSWRTSPVAALSVRD